MDNYEVEYIRCSHCGQVECDGVLRRVRDPYMSDVENTTVWVLLCDGGYQNRCDDI